jgi:hypothetical protein
MIRTYGDETGDESDEPMRDENAEKFDVDPTGALRRVKSTAMSRV